MLAKKRRLRVFVDTSAIIAGLLSPTGAAGYLLTLHRHGAIEIIVSEYTLAEIELSRFAQQPTFRKRWAAFLLRRPKIVGVPAEHWVEQARQIISAKDAPILALARQSQPDWFVGWDFEFLTERIANWLGCPVGTPGDFLRYYRSQYK